MNERKPKCTKLRDREILNKKNSVNLNLLGSLHSSTGLQIYLNFVNSNWLFCKIRPYSILLRFSYFAFQINITGYAINKFFKNGQLDHFCIFCNIIRILVIIRYQYEFNLDLCKVTFFFRQRWFKISWWRLKSRKWTLFFFFRRIFPQSWTTSKIVDDLVKFIVPRLAQCEQVRCGGNGKHAVPSCVRLSTKKISWCVTNIIKEISCSIW